MFVLDDDGDAVCAYCRRPVPDDCRPLNDGEDTEDVIAEDGRWHDRDCRVATNDGQVRSVVGRVTLARIDTWFTPDEARSFARALLAQADHAEAEAPAFTQANGGVNTPLGGPA